MGATFGATFLSLPVFFFEERSSFFFSVGAFAATFLSLPVFFFFFSVFFSRARSFSAAFAAFARSFSAAFSSRTRCLSASFASLARRFSASFSSRARCFAACFSSSACVCLSVGEAGQPKFFFTLYEGKKVGGKKRRGFSRAPSRPERTRSGARPAGRARPRRGSRRASRAPAARSRTS